MPVWDWGLCELSRYRAVDRGIGIGDSDETDAEVEVVAPAGVPLCGVWTTLKGQARQRGCKYNWVTVGGEERSPR
jgi:hypothetical protein